MYFSGSYGKIMLLISYDKFRMNLVIIFKYVLECIITLIMLVLCEYHAKFMTLNPAIVMKDGLT